MNTDFMCTAFSSLSYVFYMRKEREPFFINYEIITRSSGAKRDPQKRERERREKKNGDSVETKILQIFSFKTKF